MPKRKQRTCKWKLPKTSLEMMSMLTYALDLIKNVNKCQKA